MSQNKTIDLLQDVIKTSKAIGVQQLKKILIKARTTHDFTIGETVDKKENENFLFLINQLSLHFGITKREILYGTSFGDRTDAIRVGAAIAIREFNFILAKAAVFFNKDVSNMCKMIQQFDKISAEKHKKSIEIMKKHDLILTQIKLKIKKVK